MKIPHLARFAAALLIFATSALAQKMQTPAGEAPGPWILGTIGVGKHPDGTIKTTALKGIAIKVGEHGEAAVAYDLDLCRMAGAWTGKFTTPMNLMSRGEYPTALGDVAFTTGNVAGFISGDSSEPWKDPRPEPFGPLPRGQARFKGFYVNGDKTILKWDIGGTEVLEMPEYGQELGVRFFSRSFSSGAIKSPIRVAALATPLPIASAGTETIGDPLTGELGASFAEFEEGEETTVVGFIGGWGSVFDKIGDQVFLKLWPNRRPQRFQILVWRGPKSQKEVFRTLIRAARVVPEMAPLIQGSPARWPEPVVTSGQSAIRDPQSAIEPAYVVDTIKLPDPNPWNTPMFVGGFDFFPDGRAAVCTFHGDVFIVSGLDEKLEHVTWKRFASGLYHSLGLKIVNGEIYVTCRDGIWRLKDLNGDGECDFYEVFNNDIMVTKSFHEFVFDLQTDPQGAFYFAKAGPVKNGGRGFDEVCAHHGTFLRVSPDGAKLDVVATGFRAPNGIGVGPFGEFTSGDNEGTWTPACRINWIKYGGFYGVVDLAHRTPPPTDYDRPLCWLPKRVDNSSGGQVWATSEKWGPWRDQLLHLSYGTCSLFGVLKEEIEIPGAGDCCDHQMQGGVVRFPLKFESGVMRARFNPADGQLYVAGLRGWQTTGVKNGCFQRVRYTGAPVRMPIALHVKKEGIEISFTCALDAASATDLQNWNLEQWNYVWSASYGSPEISTKAPPEAPGEVGRSGEVEWSKAQSSKHEHDTMEVKSAKLLPDSKTVFLEIPALKPVMQMAVKYHLKSADGTDLESEIVHTIHGFGE